MHIFEGKDILVTGGCGSIGSQIITQLLPHRPNSIRVFDHHEAGQFSLSQQLPSTVLQPIIGDVRDAKRLHSATQGVDIIFHAAALKHIPLCEYNPFEAVQTNILGTQHIVEAALANRVKLVVGVSTDKAVNPINAMGASKLLSEKIMINAATKDTPTRFACVRFGNVLDSAGSVVPIFRRQIQAGGPVTITSADMKRFFMTISQAADLILHAASVMEGREIFVLKMLGLRISDLAEVMIQELGPKYGYKASDIPTKIIGIRTGEKLNEALFSEEERPFITETDKMFILRSSSHDNCLADQSAQFSNYHTSNMELLSREEIRRILKEEGIV